MVLKCEPQQERLLLSFRLSSKPALEDKKECTPKKKQEVKYQIGEVLNSMTAPFFAFCYLFSKRFDIILKKICWLSISSIKCAFLIVWLASWIKTSIVRGQNKGAPGQSFWRYQLVLLLLGGVFFLLDAADVLTPKAVAFALQKKTTSEKCF